MIVPRRLSIPGLVLAVALAGCSDATEQGKGKAAVAASPYIAMARGQVDVEGGLIRIVTARDGRIDAVKVEDGDTVRQGDVLALLDQRQAQVGVGIAEANLAQADAQVGVLKAKLAPTEQQSRRLVEAAGAGAATGQSA
ncbi:MAG TPA: biotin/lipoyl-binding protein, partial [Dokdonella sp.]